MGVPRFCQLATNYNNNISLKRNLSCHNDLEQLSATVPKFWDASLYLGTPQHIARLMSITWKHLKHPAGVTESLSSLPCLRLSLI